MDFLQQQGIKVEVIPGLIILLHLLGHFASLVGISYELLWI
jgi:hypothetical protein